MARKKVFMFDRDGGGGGLEEAGELPLTVEGYSAECVQMDNGQVSEDMERTPGRSIGCYISRHPVYAIRRSCQVLELSCQYNE